MKYHQPNEAWVLHKEEISTLKDGVSYVYFLLDAFSGFCFGAEATRNVPTKMELLRYLEKGFDKGNCWPREILILSSDPLFEVACEVCRDLNLPITGSTQANLQPFVKALKESFGELKLGGKVQNKRTDDEQKNIEAFIPQAYDPCSCASGKKYKFCCQKAFKPIVLAMCEAQDGKLDSALRYMAEAEKNVGRTAEIVCRYAVVWHFFNKEKCRELLEEAMALNPNHPRLNFLLGIEAKDAKDYQAAIAYYLKAIQNYPAESKFHINEAYNNLGTAYYESGNFKAAKESWETGLVILPTDQMVKNNLFECIYENPEMPVELRYINPFIKKLL